MNDKPLRSLIMFRAKVELTNENLFVTQHFENVDAILVHVMACSTHGTPRFGCFGFGDRHISYAFY